MKTPAELIADLAATCEAGQRTRLTAAMAMTRIPHTHGGTDAPECTLYGTECRPSGGAR
jgi:hypothetical protein